MTHTHILTKLFWAMLFVTGIGVFVYFSQDLITSYLKYETTTDIEVSSDVFKCKVL